jgi:trehalose 6-phosphate synthase
MAPLYVRQAAPDATLAHFWHIPFPPADVFRLASRGADVVRGLLANDLIGFHLPSFVGNFLRTVQQQLKIEVDFERRCVEIDGRTSWVRALPISIDVNEFRSAAKVPDAEARIQRIRKRFAPNGELLGVGVDRVDYSKGLEEKLKALDFVWERNPELRERFTFVQIAVPSRTDIEAYDRLNEKIERMTWSINERYGTDKWTPIHLLNESWPAGRLAILYRAADLCLIASLQDGMNLVAKEFVASQIDRRGVLVLSQFAGAVDELQGCVVVNPYDPEQFASIIKHSLAMPSTERIERMEKLQSSLRSIYDWMDELFTLWGAAARGEEVPLALADRWG